MRGEGRRENSIWARRRPPHIVLSGVRGHLRPLPFLPFFLMPALEPYHKWQPITDLEPGWEKLASAQLKSLTVPWKKRLAELRGSEGLKQFNDRLARQWSIETGIIEGIYKIDRGITELLVERGLEASLIPHGTTDRPAEDVVAILRDHHDALEGLYAFVAAQRDLSISYIRELHQQLCRGQEVTVGRDAVGNRTERRLRLGDWKKQPNSPHRPDGRVHEYCPPEHVASEMDELIRMHKEHVAAGVAPEVEAAWLHHRFTQIHPFEDGNGRVARALATLVLLRAELFPFVVDRKEKNRYIDALESADQGSLGQLASMVSATQQKALMLALDISQ